MLPALGAALRGVAIGLAVASVVGALTCVVLTVVGWPGPDAQAEERARHLAESISEGMYWALMTSIVLVPACAIVLVRRTRLEGGGE
ncbi:MAG: hypothetical protein KF764_16985 [Labilithrix sp.]|nr:hypothetical protein [Labilithrix sp.]